MPWYTVASTSVSAEDAESITDYINSGGSCNDIGVVTMYVKKLMDVETLKLFTLAHTKAIEERSLHCARTTVGTLCSVVLGRAPCCACLTKVFQRSWSSNAMGSRGENTITFSEALMFE